MVKHTITAAETVAPKKMWAKFVPEKQESFPETLGEFTFMQSQNARCEYSVIWKNVEHFMRNICDEEKRKETLPVCKGL